MAQTEERSKKLKALFWFLSAFTLIVLGGCPGTGNDTGYRILPVLYVVPAPNSLAPINTRIEIHFSKPLDQSTIQPGLFVLLDSAGKSVQASVTYAENASASDYVLSLQPVSYAANPPVWLAANSSYSAVMGGGIRARDGTSQTVFSAWSFQTRNSTDVVAPTFGGILSATAIDTASVKLTWGPAIDNPGGTPSNQLTFSVCISDSPTICKTSFFQTLVNPPADIDSNGNYSYLVTRLSPDVIYYFLVRVEDTAGNWDQNNVQLSASTLSGKLYISNFQSNEILGVDHPSTLGSRTGARSIQASWNGIAGPYGTFFDAAKNRLYVASCKSESPQYTLLDTFASYKCVTGTSKISVYNNATTLSGGDQKPDYVIQSQQFNGPLGIYIEHATSADTLYVANFVGGDVAVINNVIATCTVSPCMLSAVPVAHSSLTAPMGVAYDTVHGLLYVSNYISVFSKRDPTTGIYSAAVPGTTVLVFDSSFNLVKTINAPPQTPFPSNPSGLVYPAGLWLDGDTLYIVNAGPSLPGGFPGIVAICNASFLQNNINGYANIPAASTCTAGQPGAQYLTGSQTGLSWPVAMAATAAPSTTPAFYVSDYSDNAIKVYTPVFNPTAGVNNTLNNIAPLFTIRGLGGEVLKPVGVSAGTTGGFDYLMAADLGRDMVLFFDHVPENYSVKCPPPAPYACLFPADRIISPTLAGVTGIVLNNTTNPSGIFQDRLYAASYFNNSVVVLDWASTLSGNATTSIYNVITNPGLRNPYGVFVDTSQGREWVYVLNGTPDSTGTYSILVFDMAKCISTCAPDRVIQSADLQNPAGIWVDEGVDVGQTAPRDILYVSNRGVTTYGSPGAILVFKNSSILNGSVPADKKVQGGPSIDDTGLLTPAGLSMDPDRGDLYVANEARQMILVFNQPNNCISDPLTRICNIAPTRKIFNNQYMAAPFDTPAAVALDLKSMKLFVSTLGFFDNAPSVLLLSNALYLNGDTVPSGYFSSFNNSTVFLNRPMGLAFDNLR